MLFMLYVLLLFFEFSKSYPTSSAGDSGSAVGIITLVYQECNIIVRVCFDCCCTQSKPLGGTPVFLSIGYNIPITYPTIQEEFAF
jgi:hypothetical protein